MKDSIKLKDKKNVLMVAHRGLSGLEQENTNAAFIAAANRSYFGIECDVHLTADGEFVIMHDHNTKRTGGVDLDIEKTDYATLRSLILLEKTGKKGRTDLRIPSLAEYISICRDYGKRSVLELKSDFTPEYIEKMCGIIDSEEYFDGVTFISFNYENLVKLKKLRPESTVQFLTDKWNNALIEKLAAADMDLDIYYGPVNEALVAKCRKEGVEINCWTVDSVENAEKLIALGVDYITSNILE